MSMLTNALRRTTTRALSMNIIRPTVSRVVATPMQTRAFSKQEKPWGKQAVGPTFNPDIKTEFRKSQIEGAGNGWWAIDPIKKGVRVRRVAVEDGSLLKFGSKDDLVNAGWDVDDAVNYGIGHHLDPSSIFFLNPGTAMNHADSTREASVKYFHNEPGVIELWTVKDIEAGEEMFNEYQTDFGKCPWYDELQRSRGNVPLSQLNQEIEKLYATPQEGGRFEVPSNLAASFSGAPRNSAAAFASAE